MPYDTDSAIMVKLEAFAKSGPHDATLPLAEATPFDWDDVFFFLEGTKKAEINRVVGLRVFKDEDSRIYEPGPLLVFTAGNKIVHAAIVMPPVHMAEPDRYRYSRQEAVLRATTRDPGPYMLQFVK